MEAVHTITDPGRGRVQVIAEDRGRVVHAQEGPLDRIPIIGPLARAADKVRGIWEDITHLFG